MQISIVEHSFSIFGFQLKFELEVMIALIVYNGNIHYKNVTAMSFYFMGFLV